MSKLIQVTDAEEVILKAIRMQTFGCDSESYQDLREQHPEAYAIAFRRGSFFADKELQDWIRSAFEVIEQGVELMTTEQLAQWKSVRTVQENCPIDEGLQ